MSGDRRMPTPLPRVFISYSIRPPGDEPQFASTTKVFVDRLYERLVAGGRFHPFRDSEDIPLGADWLDEIHRALYSCHGCILVLSKESLESSFVCSEVGAMLNRLLQAKDASDSFVLLPIYLGDIDHDALKTSELGRTGIARQQMRPLRCDFPERPEKTDLAIEAIEKRLNDSGICGARTPREIMIAEAAQRLKVWESGTGMARGELPEIGKKHFGWREPINRTGEQIFSRFAEALCSVSPVTARKALHLLSQKGCSSVNRLLDIVAPFWVPENVAAPVVRTAFGDPKKRNMTLPDPEALFVELYIARSFYRPLYRLPKMVGLPSPTTEFRVTEITRHLADELLQTDVRNDPGRGRNRLRRLPPDQNRLIELLKTFEVDGEPVFIVFPAAVVDESTPVAGDTDVLQPLVDFDLIRELRRTGGLDTLNIIVQHNPCDPSQLESGGLSVTRLELMDAESGKQVVNAYGAF